MFSKVVCIQFMNKGSCSKSNCPLLHVRNMTELNSLAVEKNESGKKDSKHAMKPKPKATLMDKGPEKITPTISLTTKRPATAVLMTPPKSRMAEGKPTKEVCKFFRDRGYCKFEDRCWQLHTAPRATKIHLTDEKRALPSTMKKSSKP